jgi:glycosyltransferase involved in cell wall biosynthesis
MHPRDPPRFVNGKFLRHRTTGTERFARGLLGALDDALPDSADWTLLCPPGTDAPRMRRIRVRHVGPAGLPPHLWEQAALPAAARGGMLLNLAGSAPWFGAATAVATIHDAAVFDHPSAYARPFVAWYRRLFAHLALDAAGLVTVSAFSRGRLSAALGTSEARWAVVPDGCDHLDAVVPDPSALQRFGLQGRRFLLGVASANPTKNLSRLVEAFGRLCGAPDGSDAAVRLVLVGGRNDAVFAAAVDPSGPPRVLRTGPVDDATLKTLYLHARALIFPSLYEGFGLPPLEAMALGCPVVAACAASLPEVCGDAALYVDPTSVESIADGMRRVLDDDALCARLAVAGRARAATMTWAAAAQRLLAALDSLDAAPRG